MQVIPLGIFIDGKVFRHLEYWYFDNLKKRELGIWVY